MNKHNTNKKILRIVEYKDFEALQGISLDAVRPILITIEDGFKSFYTEAWPYLKNNKMQQYEMHC